MQFAPAQPRLRRRVLRAELPRRPGRHGRRSTTTSPALKPPARRALQPRRGRALRLPRGGGRRRVGSRATRSSTATGGPRAGASSSRSTTSSRVRDAFPGRIRMYLLAHDGRDCAAALVYRVRCPAATWSCTGATPTTQLARSPMNVLASRLVEAALAEGVAEPRPRHLQRRRRARPGPHPVQGERPGPAPPPPGLRAPPGGQAGVSRPATGADYAVDLRPRHRLRQLVHPGDRRGRRRAGSPPASACSSWAAPPALMTVSLVAAGRRGDRRRPRPSATWTAPAAAGPAGRHVRGRPTSSDCDGACALRPRRGRQPDPRAPRPRPLPAPLPRPARARAASLHLSLQNPHSIHRLVALEMGLIADLHESQRPRRAVRHAPALRRRPSWRRWREAAGLGVRRPGGNHAQAAAQRPDGGAAPSRCWRASCAVAATCPATAP